MKSKKPVPLHEPADERGNLSYKLRMIEEQEAQEEIDEYCTNERNPDRLDGLGLKRGQRR